MLIVPTFVTDTLVALLKNPAAGDNHRHDVAMAKAATLTRQKAEDGNVREYLLRLFASTLAEKSSIGTSAIGGSVCDVCIVKFRRVMRSG